MADEDYYDSIRSVHLNENHWLPVPPFAEHVDLEEAKSLFETNYSHVYYILYDTFVQAEQNLKQRGEALLFLLPSVQST